MATAFSFVKVCDARWQAQKCLKPAQNDELLRCTIEFCLFLTKLGPVISPKALLD
jgi:hypothetical protein